MSHYNNTYNNSLWLNKINKSNQVYTKKCDQLRIYNQWVCT